MPSSADMPPLDLYIQMIYNVYTVIKEISKMKKTARILITTKCNRNCPGCANEKFIKSDEMHIMEHLTEIVKYNEIIITGGEPMLQPNKVANMIWDIRYISKAPIFMYSSTVDLKVARHNSILRLLDGLTYTVHYESTMKDIMMLQYLSTKLKNFAPKLKTRLLLDSRLPQKYELLNIDFGAWDIVKWLEWKQDGDCPLPEHETGYYYKVF